MSDPLGTARLRERLIALTRDLVLIPGSEGRPEELKRAIHWVRNHLEGLDGVVIDLFESEGIPSLVARSSSHSEIDVLLCAHIDVVHHPDPDSYQSKLAGSRIYGPGTGDMKGIVAILLELFRRFHLESPGVPLALAITADEERGGEQGTRALFEDFGLKCRVAIVPDGGTPDDVVVEEKGILHLKLESTGAACHAARPWLGHNALEKLMTCAEAIQKLFPPFNADLFHWHSTCSITRIDTW
jgi:succinyl-diaminopimelate desuccinylase